MLGCYLWLPREQFGSPWQVQLYWRYFEQVSEVFGQQLPSM